MQKTSGLKPLLKYPGGKTAELDLILSWLPSRIENYIEPFVGGGAVFFSISGAEKYYINDISRELILLYKYVKSQNSTFFQELDFLIKNWEQLASLMKTDRLATLYFAYRNLPSLNLEESVSDAIDEALPDEPMFNLFNSEILTKYFKKRVVDKMLSMKKNEIKRNRLLGDVEIHENLEAGIKSAYYMYFRDAYNNPKAFRKFSDQRQAAIYFFIREYCFSAMFRFNRNGEFNVPYGGVSYNKKSLQPKKNYFKNPVLKEHLGKTEIFNKDFHEFLKTIDINENDFMFLDPPYDTTFSEYDENSFGQEDQRRLADYLINDCPCNFLLIIKKTPFILSLYENKNLHISENPKNYFVSFMNRKKEDREVTHLIITNYAQTGGEHE